MTNEELHLIEEEACLLPMTICGRNKVENIPTFLLVEFYANSNYRNYAIHKPIISRELENRLGVELNGGG